MIATPTLLLFLAAAWALILIPGPDILYVMTRGIVGGRRAGIVSALAVGSGEVLHTLMVAAGLAGILVKSLTTFLIIKYLGAAYLLHLGIQMIRDKHALSLLTTSVSAPLAHVYRQGVLTNLLNPKAVLFYVAFLPQFVDPVQGNARLQVVFLGLLFALSDILFLLILARATSYVHRWLTRQPLFMTRLRRICGSILIGLGIRLAVTERV